MTEKPDPLAPFIRWPGHSVDPDARPLTHLETCAPQHFLDDLAARGHMMTMRWGYTRTEANPHPMATLCFVLGGWAGKHYAVRSEWHEGRCRGVVYRWEECAHSDRQDGRCVACGVSVRTPSST